MTNFISYIIAAGSPTEALASTLQTWVGPILLLVIGILAIKFLMNSQIMAFVMFIITAILVALVFYYPGIIKTIAGAFYDGSGANSW